MRFIHSLRRGSVRTRLVMLVLAPPLPIGLVLHWGNSAYDQLLIYKVNAELTIARQYFDRVLDGQKQAIAGLAASGRLRSVLDNPARLGALLATQAGAQRFDYLYVLDREGRVRASSNDASPGEARTDWPVVRGALAADAKVALSVFDAARLEAISPPLLSAPASPSCRPPTHAPTRAAGKTAAW
ncbi:MAG: hypothetical protein RBS46_00225 [Methyloversatilis sp.]|jgi:two-component system NtrC family sensor kinase|nr:hypothetical protein [Methyloversatilis sp.]